MVKDDDNCLGATLKMLRVDAGLSVRALAEKVGVSGAYLSRVENGHDPAPTPARLIALADALHIAPSSLLELAHQTGTALAGYLDNVPAANGFFLEVARRGLDAKQLARLHQLMHTEFGAEAAGQQPEAKSLRSLVGNRIILGAKCRSIEAAIQLGVARLVSKPSEQELVTQQIVEREHAMPTVLGDGVCVPHSYFARATGSRASLVTLDGPLKTNTSSEILVRVILVLVSKTPGQVHLEALAEIARLASHHLISRIHAATKPADVKKVFRELELHAA